MVQIFPFRALRPTNKLVNKIATLPYDVINSKEAKKMAENNSCSYLHIDKAEIDLPEETPANSSAIYAKAAQNLKLFKEKNG